MMFYTENLFCSFRLMSLFCSFTCAQSDTIQYINDVTEDVCIDIIICTFLRILRICQHKHHMYWASIDTNTQICFVVNFVFSRTRGI